MSDLALTFNGIQKHFARLFHEGKSPTALCIAACDYEAFVRALLPVKQYSPDEIWLYTYLGMWDEVRARAQEQDEQRRSIAGVANLVTGQIVPLIRDPAYLPGQYAIAWERNES